MIKEIESICEIKCEEELTKYNTYRVNSVCHALVFPKTIKELKEVLSILKKYSIKYLILGNGSNVILPSYYDGIIIKLSNFSECNIKGNEVVVGAGYMFNKLSSELSNMEYTGYEWAVGIPGTVGGCIYNNAGAYKMSMSDLLISVTVLKNDEIIELSCNECNFGYRTSLFKEEKDYVILSCKLKLHKGNLDEIKSLISDRTKRRMETQPLNYPSCGSVFRNPDNIPAGKVIEEVGLKGYSIGGAKVSELHANFIINTGKATSEDIIKLINVIKDKVKNETDIDLILEQEIIKG